MSLFGLQLPVAPGLPVTRFVMPVLPYLDTALALRYRARTISPTTRTRTREFDAAVDALVIAEKRTGIMTQLLPHGSLASMRKSWSYGGVLADGRDPGNRIYGALGRNMVLSGGPIALDWLSDEKIGDVFEAILYLGYEAQASPEVIAFARLVNHAVLILERIVWPDPFLAMETSSRIATCLL